nr:hypothetical protein [Staphylococcus sp. NRL 22/194]
MDIQTTLAIILFGLSTMGLVVYYFLRKLDKKIKINIQKSLMVNSLCIMYHEMENIFVKDIGFGK